jgi:large conductance mechanosensitive channel
VLKEFRDFVNRGSVVDLAIGVIIGAAFAPIVATLVNNIVMPPIGLLLGGVDFSSLGIVLGGGEYESVAAAMEAGAPVIAYGLFINAVVQFLITAFAVFLLVRAYSRAKKRWEKKADEAPEEAPAPPRDEVLLAEIRDLLAAQRPG